MATTVNPILTNDPQADFLVASDATSGNQSYTLPAANAAIYKRYLLVKTDSGTNTASLASAGSDLIDGAATVSVTAQYEALTVLSDGSSWHVVSRAQTGGDSLKIANGTALLPSLAFNSDPDTGVYRVSANTLGISTGGVLALTVGSAGQLTPVGVVLGANGTAGAPSFSFASDPDTGVFRAAANELGFTAGGTQQFSMVGAQLFPANAGTASVPSYAMQGDVNTGIYGVGADILGIATGGALVGKADGANWTLGAATPAASSTHNMNCEFLVQSMSLTGVNVQLTTENTSNTASSQATHLLQVAGGTAGDAFTQWVVSGAQGWAAGVDNSAADAFVIAASQVLGSSNALSISTAGVVSIPGTFSVTGIASFPAGHTTKVSTANTANPPTNAELISAFGAAATVGSGFIGIVDDNAGHANEYLIFSDGTKFWQITATAAA